MIEIFKVALAQRLLFLSMGMIYFTMEEIVLSCCKLTPRHLGATLFKLRLHRIYKSHVTASMHHGTWGLMQSHFFAQIIEDPTHHILNEPALGGYQLVLSKIQDNSRMTRLHYYDYSRLMGATQLDFI